MTGWRSSLVEFSHRGRSKTFCGQELNRHVCEADSTGVFYQDVLISSALFSCSGSGCLHVSLQDNYWISFFLGGGGSLARQTHYVGGIKHFYHLFYSPLQSVKRISSN